MWIVNEERKTAMRKFSDWMKLGVSALALSASTSVYAQQADAPKDAAAQAAEDVTGNDDIVVTAQFRSQKLQDTPIAITAVNAEMLEARGQTDVSQIAAQAPNVVLRPQPQNGGSGLIAFIRGVGQTDFNFAVDPGVGVYIDDVYIPTLSSSLLDLMDLERVEILRGPQGTLAGKNSIGGAIKLFSAKPDGSGKGSVEVTYGSFNRLDVRGMADFKLSDTLFARVSGVAKSHDGHVKLLDYGVSHPGSNVPANNARGGNAVVGTQGGQSYVAGRLALRWQPIETLDINVSGDYTSDHSEPAGTVLIAAGRPGPTASNPNPFNPTLGAANPLNTNPATNANGGAWLTGRNGQPVPVNCAFVPAGPYSCDTLASSVYNGDRRFISYANFVDGTVATTQSPFKPYSALQNQNFVGWGIHGNVTLDLSDSMNLNWISSYRKYQSNFSQDQDATPVPVAQLDNQLNHHAWSQELRLNGKLGGDLIDYTLGGFYFKQRGVYTARVDLNYAGIDFIHGPDQTPSKSKAIFLNTTFHPTEAWSVNAGVRQSWDQKDYTYFRSNPDGSVPGPGPCTFFLQLAGVVPGPLTAGPTGVGNAPNCLLLGLYNVSAQFKGKRTDWRIETDYRFSPEVFVYASAATGYKGGGVNPRPFFGPSNPSCSPTPTPNCNQVQAFRPETLTTYELGFKSDLLDRNLRVNGAVFLNKYKDIQLQLTRCPAAPCLLPANAGTADVKGFELEVRANPAEGFTLDGSLSYLDFKYTSILPSTSIPIANVTSYTPKWTYSFGAQYDIAVGEGKLSTRLDGQYQSKIFTDANNSIWSKVDPRFLANARMSYTTGDKDWQIALEVQNLFDKYYFTTVADATGGLGVETGVPGLPRTFAVTVKRNF
jgi:iron complex outermembrane recepter protein